MVNETLTTKLLQAYTQAFLFLVVVFFNVIIGMMVGMVGGFQAFNALNNGDQVTFIIGLSIALVGYLIIIIGFYAAMIYSATKGSKKPLGYVDAWKETIGLILELAVAVIAGVVIIIIGSYLGMVGFLFYFLGAITLMLFPLAALFYVLNFLQKR